MLFSDITDCEMLVFKCIQDAKQPISLVQIMDVLEEKYERDWKRSTVCTFVSHLIEKGYVTSKREGRTFYYASAINDRKFREEQVRQFMEFWFEGSLFNMISSMLKVKKISKKDTEAILGVIQEVISEDKE